jgi:membrane peptidoglycan carboxypeptidase
MIWLGHIISKFAVLLLHREWKYLRPQLLGLHRRHLCEVSSGPPWIAQALLISGEDHRFFDHAGIDFIAVCRAIWRGLALRRREGASTIEMQLVRVLTCRFERTLVRKIREAGLATLLASAVPKHDIPALYLRVAYYGTGMRNFSAACARLSLDPLAMNPRQAARLVARLKYPEPAQVPEIRSDQLAQRTEYLLSLYNRHVKGDEYRGLISGAEYAPI